MNPAPDGGYGARRAWRVLCVFPRYAHSFGTFQHAYELMLGVRAFMPPQGILSVASYLPREWTVRVVDENVRALSDADLAWSEAVLDADLVRFGLGMLARVAWRSACEPTTGARSGASRGRCWRASEWTRSSTSRSSRTT